ncbi:hypothetical protein CRE_02473 [Caenorhabditis remanei]|uniref:Serpentine Receptor, class H n=1 Tax=Caenorhabditis remanei TaxID=31234 RepID=E3MWQ1_CAERE|nr:hypothetical protein CRE_02473 [Caenorhabditis remanei]
MHLPYMSSPEFLASALHIMTCLEVPVHLFGAYCIIFKTPAIMKSVKFSMLNLHFWSVLLDLTISLLTAPYVLFPALVGRSIGILTFFGVSTPIQLYLIVTLFPSNFKSLILIQSLSSWFSAVGVSITAILENRYYLLFARDTFWKFFRIPFLGSLYLASFSCFLPCYFNIPDQKEAMKEVLEKTPALLEYTSNSDLFVLSTDFHLFFFTLVIMIALVTGTSVTFARLLHRNMKERSQLMNVSNQTIQLQKIFFRAIFIQCIQTSMPICILIFPLNYLVFSMYSGYFNQAANNLCFIVTAFHGLLSTTIMVIVHKPYRDVFYDTFCERIHRILVRPGSRLTFSLSTVSKTTG